MVEFKLKQDIKRFATTSGRYYGPSDLDVLHQYKNPLKPSWTNVASCESSTGLSEWKMIHGYWSGILASTAATKGTITHDAIDLMNQGHKIDKATDWILNELETSDDIRWKMVHTKWEMVETIKKQIMGYIAFYNEHKPKILASELFLWHPDVPYAGTADLILSIYNKRQDQDIIMLADLKTGSENEKHFEQCMAYAILLERIYNVKVGAIGSLYSTGKWRDKPGFKMKVKVLRNKAEVLTEDAKKLCSRVEAVYNLWKSKQKTEQPRTKPKLPNTFSLNITKESK